MSKHIYIAIPFVLSSLIITIISYLRYYLTGHISLEEVYPNSFWSPILFLLYFIAIILSAVAYYNVLFKNTYSFFELKTLSYIVFFVSFLSLPLLSNDIFIYLAIGDITANIGLNPYTDFRFFYLSSFDDYVSLSWRYTPYFKYGALQAIMMYVIAFIGGDNIWINMFLYKALVLLVGFVFIEFAYFLLKTKQNIKEPTYAISNGNSYDKRRIFAFIVLAPVLWIQGVGQGHNDIFVALLLFLGLYFMLEKRFILSSFFFALSFNIKLYALLALFMLFYYIILNYRLSYLAFRNILVVVVVSVCVSIISYIPFWDGIDSILLPYGALFSELSSPMNSLSFLLGFFVLNVIPSISSIFSYELFRYIILIPAVILGIYLLYLMRQDISSFVYFCGKAFILFFSFGVVRFHPWYFMTALVFFSFKDISRGWLLWASIFFASVNLVDIYNFMNHDSLAIKIALPLSLVFVNLFLLLKIKGRFIT